LTTNKSWQQRIGNQRDWVWRGWQTRYTYMRCSSGSTNSTPLIFIHGFGACIEHWRNNLSVLSQKHPVYAIDLLGFGASRKAASGYSAYLWAEQVYDFWRTFIDRPVILVGNSIGSLVCMTAAAEHPEMVKGIVMLSLPDPNRSEAIPKIASTLEDALALPAIIKTIYKIVRQPRLIRRILKLAYVNLSSVDDELIEIITAPSLDRDADRAFFALFKSVRKPNYAPSAPRVLPNLKIPILLIWGDRDRVVPPTLAPRFTQMNPQIKLVELKNVGHCPHDEVPDLFNQNLLDWLESNFEET
jgi:pimeloyl-ACP methyl ester carboxylesterase